MTKTPVTAAALAALLLWPALAPAQPLTDDDGDGLYSFPEMTDAFPDLSVNAFLDIDANEDGRVDAEELVAAREAGLLPGPGEAQADAR